MPLNLEATGRERLNLAVSDEGGYHPISALVRHLVLSKVAKCIMAVPGWSQARGGGGGRRQPMAKQPY